MGVHDTIDLDIMIAPGYTWETAPSDLNVLDVWEHITGYCVRGQISRGRGSVLDEFGAGIATVTVRNDDQRFDPSYASGAYYPDLRPMCPIRITIHDPTDGVWHDAFWGYITGFEQSWGRDGLDPEVTLECVDAFKVLNMTQCSSDVATNRSGTQFDAVLDDIGWPANARVVSLGQVSLQAFKARLEPALGVLKRIAKSEGGWCYVDRLGQVAFRDRFHRPRAKGTVSLTITDQGGAEGQPDLVTMGLDDTQIWNVVATQLQGKTKTEKKHDTQSKNRYGRRVLSQYGLLLKDQDEATWANWTLRTFKDPYWRAEASVLLHDPLNDACQLSRLDVDDRVTLVREGSPLAGGLDMYVEGMSHRWDTERWVMGISLSEASQWAVWILGTAGFSELGETTWLG